MTDTKIEVVVTVEVEGCDTTDQAEQYVRDCINTEPDLRVTSLSWSKARKVPA